MTKLPWHGKESASSHKIFIAAKPGEIVSVNQMESTEVGFFTQLKGSLTKKRYRYCNVFVDHFSRLHFVHFQIDNSSAETMLAKQAFEKFAAKHGVRIQHHHCDNGQFADNAWKQSCKASHQRLTFCRVNAHFQNGIVERVILDLLESTPTSSYSMLMLAGQQRCILHCGHMPCAMPPFSTTVCQCWRMGHRGLSYSAQFE